VPTQLSASSRVTLLRLAGCSGKLPETPVAALEVMQRTMRKLVMVPDRTKQDEDTQSAVGLLAVLMDVAEAMRVWCAASASSREQKVLALADYSSDGSFEAYFRYRPGQPLAARHTAQAWERPSATSPREFSCAHCATASHGRCCRLWVILATQAWAWYSSDRGFIRDRQARA
jgi:hypothetical protein